MAALRKLAGLDIGTTGCKLTVFAENGEVLDKAYQDYPSSRTQTHEVDAGALLDGVFSVLKTIAARHSNVAGIGITSFGETFVMTDAQGKPLHNAMLYTDPRGSEECAWLVEQLGMDKIISITGVNPHEMYSISKIMWLKKHRPELFSKAAHIFLMEDLVVHALTGTAQIDYSLATRTMAFDLKSLDWSREILDKAGIDPTLFSRPVPTGTAAGTLLPEIAALTGFSPETQVVSISHDQIAAAVGAGAFDSSVAVDGAGTVECLTPIYDTLPDLNIMSQGKFAVVPYVFPGKYVCYAFSYTGGALIQWCVDTMAKLEKEMAAAQGISVNALLEAGDDRPTGLLVLPHFAGAATPYMDSGAKGAIIGLTAGTTLNEIYRACMEGVAYEMKLNYEHLLPSGVCFERIHATGGGAHSEVWMQMKADMLNIPITALETVDAGTVGSAMLTGIAVGIYSDLEEAARIMVRPIKVYEPRPEQHQAYSEIYERYRKVYEAVRPLM